MKICNYCGRTFELDDEVSEVKNTKGYSENICKSCLTLTKPIKIDVTTAPINAIDIKVIFLYPERKCPDCGLTEYDLRISAKFGCSTCYDYFRDEFLAVASSIHYGSVHVGKVPKLRQYVPETPKEKIQHLKLLKARAIEHENFEEAARLTEELNKLTLE